MYYLKYQKTAFNLTEISVALTVLALLAALAFPNIASYINRSRANEALATLDAMKEKVMISYELAPDVIPDVPDSSKVITVSDLQLGVQGNFYYEFGAESSGGNCILLDTLNYVRDHTTMVRDYCLQASPGTSHSDTDFIRITINADDAINRCYSIGKFAGICEAPLPPDAGGG